ncbi:SCO family protein [bacterium]|nr:MAG: SCO family protein [bacterium]
MNDKKIKWVFIGLPAVLLLMIVGAWGIHKIKSSNSGIPVFGKVTSFSFTERNAEPFGSNELSGKVSIVNFFFTTCEGPCPRMNARVAELYKYFSAAASVQFVSISVDPVRDSLQALGDYAARFGVNDRRWLFLRAPIDDVKSLSENVFMLAGGDMPSLHSTKLILVDEQNSIRGYYSSDDPKDLQLLKKHILVLVED